VCYGRCVEVTQKRCNSGGSGESGESGGVGVVRMQAWQSCNFGIPIPKI
jgi:hypothetical protein